MSDNNTKEITQLVNKIVKARKIQKDRIEGNQESLFQEHENIQKMQQPVVQAITSSTRDTIQALENQQNNMEVALHAIENKMEENQANISQVVDSRKDPNWIQHFYKKYRSNKALSKMEISLKGELGNHGHVDISLLFNKGKVRISYGTKKNHQLASDKTTSGLLGLLLLPYSDLKDALDSEDFEVTERDIEIYGDIMLKCGVAGSKNGRKYQVFIKSLDNSLDSEEELERLTPMQAARERSLQKKDDEIARKRFGLGVFSYRDPKELDSRLDVLLGSMQAGNNNNSIRQECRSILDKMLEIDYIPYTIHKKFYQKFNL